MYTIINQHEFADIIASDEYNNFSYSQACALYDYLEEFYEDGNGMQMDKVAIRCEYAVYNTVEEYIADYSYLFDDDFKAESFDDVQDADNIAVHDDDFIIINTNY